MPVCQHTIQVPLAEVDEVCAHKCLKLATMLCSAAWITKAEGVESFWRYFSTFKGPGHMPG